MINFLELDENPTDKNGKIKEGKKTCRVLIRVDSIKEIKEVLDEKGYSTGTIITICDGTVYYSTEDYNLQCSYLRELGCRIK